MLHWASWATRGSACSSYESRLSNPPHTHTPKSRAEIKGDHVGLHPARTAVFRFLSVELESPESIAALSCSTENVKQQETVIC